MLTKIGIAMAAVLAIGFASAPAFYGITSEGLIETRAGLLRRLAARSGPPRLER